ncbi:MAG: hypothetical protein JNK09_04745 [Prolixibacteraceae bacterium]|nr:hypothetical protein [Prolixibacteraceae bacterium]
MEKINRHIVHRFNLEMNTGREQLAYSLHSRLDYFLNDDLLPKFEKLFDRASSPDQIKRFDSIDLEINMDAADNLTDVSDEIIRTLQAKIEAADFAASSLPEEIDHEIFFNPDEPDIRRQYQQIEKQIIQKARQLNPETNLHEIFVHFLETGQILWYGSPTALKDYILSIENAPEIFPDYPTAQLKEVFRVNSKALNRFFHQMSPAFIQRFILRLSALQSTNIPERLVRLPIGQHVMKKLVFRSVIIRLIDPNYRIREKELRQISIELLAEKQATKRTAIALQIVELFQSILLEVAESSGKITAAGSLLMELVLAKNQPAHSQKPSEQVRRNDYEETVKSGKSTKAELFEKQTDVERDDDRFSDFEKDSQVEIYIQNAGLILTHPFLWNFLTNLKCTDGKNQLLPEKTFKAIHLLHYLASGKENDFEFNMAFEKFLCGVPQEMTVDREIAISGEEKLECDNLLRTIIGYWPALKNTSPDGLRQLFFQRNGKLDLQKFPPKLYVERKAQDILLESLEWNISIVKLPWMTELLFVEW